jgi:hypothetical protein
MQCTFAGNERGGIAKLLVFAIIVGALYAGYYYFQGTPRYALIQFKKAIVFSNGETAEKFLDVDSVANNLPEQITLGADRETLKKRILYEIDSPHEKNIFASAKKWNVFTVPIDINDEVATTEPDKDTYVRLEKTKGRRWVITSIQFNKSQETQK